MAGEARLTGQLKARLWPVNVVANVRRPLLILSDGLTDGPLTQGQGPSGFNASEALVYRQWQAGDVKRLIYAGYL